MHRSLCYRWFYGTGRQISAAMMVLLFASAALITIGLFAF